MTKETDNCILILDKEKCIFNIIYNVPDSIISSQENVENLLEDVYGYDLRKISWISKVDVIPDDEIVAAYDYCNPIEKINNLENIQN